MQKFRVQSGFQLRTHLSRRSDLFNIQRRLQCKSIWHEFKVFTYSYVRIQRFVKVIVGKCIFLLKIIRDCVIQRSCKHVLNGYLFVHIVKSLNVLKTKLIRFYDKPYVYFDTVGVKFYVFVRCDRQEKQNFRTTQEKRTDQQALA